MPDSQLLADRAIAEDAAFDAHMDALQRAVDLEHDLGTRTPGHFDLVRAREGGLGAVVLVCWIDPATLPDGAADRARALIAAAHALEERHPEALLLVREAEDLSRSRQSGRIAGLIGIEGGHAIENDLRTLEEFATDGLRVMTLCWNNHLEWIRSCQPDAPAGTPDGLSDFGRDVVRKMNELGVVVDLSHASERALFDTLEVTNVPVIASHSGCTAVYDHRRNLSDDGLRALADNGGVVGVVLHPGFLDAEADADERRLRQEDGYRALRQSNPTAQHLAQSEWMAERAAPLSVERWVDHVEHACEIAGPLHVGIGTDFDGIERSVAGVPDARGYRCLARALFERGFDEATVRGVLGGNMQRVFAAALPR
ncbi:MAG: dipeptidase [Planctomycetota bacterium]|jgi:membrane dipeptidase